MAEVLPAGWEQSFPADGTHSAVIGKGTSLTEIDFGNRERSGIPCDLDGDGDVDFTDFSVLSANFTGTLPLGPGTKAQDQGDCDGDGDVDFADFSVLAGNFTGTLTAPRPAPQIQPQGAAGSRSTATKADVNALPVSSSPNAGSRTTDAALSQARAWPGSAPWSR